jgi:hypothetical protein
MILEKFTSLLQRAEKEESLASRRPRMAGGALYGFIAGLSYGITVGIIDAIFFPNLPIAIEWGPSILTGVILGLLLALVGALTGWYSETSLGVGAGAVAIAVIGIGVQLFVVGVGAIGVILLVVLAFPISVLSLPIAIVLRWLSGHYTRILAVRAQHPWRKAGWMVLLCLGAMLLGLVPGAFQRMGIREERSAILVDMALRLALTDPEQAKRLPLETLPGLKEHLGTPFTLRVTRSKISSVGYDIHVRFSDGFAITCVTVAYTSTPYMRSCSAGADIIQQ